MYCKYNDKYSATQTTLKCRIVIHMTQKYMHNTNRFEMRNSNWFLLSKILHNLNTLKCWIVTQFDYNHSKNGTPFGPPCELYSLILHSINWICSHIKVWSPKWCQSCARSVIHSQCELSIICNKLTKHMWIGDKCYKCGLCVHLKRCSHCQSVKYCVSIMGILHVAQHWLSNV